jgi:hypothetical protein
MPVARNTVLDCHIGLRRYALDGLDRCSRVSSTQIPVAPRIRSAVYRNLRDLFVRFSKSDDNSILIDLVDAQYPGLIGRRGSRRQKPDDDFRRGPAD